MAFKKKRYEIHQEHPNFINVHLIEDDEEAGGYIIPNDSKTYIKGFLKREGYEEVRENENAKI